MAGLFLDDRSQQHFEALLLALEAGGVAAFIGAGLSMGAKPNWESLHEKFRVQAGVSDGYRFRSLSAPADFSIFREESGEPDFFRSVQEAPRQVSPPM